MLVRLLGGWLMVDSGGLTCSVGFTEGHVGVTSLLCVGN